jgi:cell division protein DivIC
MKKNNSLIYKTTYFKCTFIKNKTMKKYMYLLKNKFIFTSCLFFVYILFLDDVDIFTIINQNNKLSKLEIAKQEVSGRLKNLRFTLKKLHYVSELENYARENKLFKKDDEEIFIISYTKRKSN